MDSLGQNTPYMIIGNHSSKYKLKKNSGCERFSAENDNANLVKSNMNMSIGIALLFTIFHKNGLNVILWARKNVDGDIWGE